MWKWLGAIRNAGVPISASSPRASRARRRIGLWIASRPSARRIASERSGTPSMTRAADQTPSSAGTGRHVFIATGSMTLS